VIAPTDFHLSHFQAMTLFALLISIAFGFLSRRRTNDRLKYIIWSLFLFFADWRGHWLGHVSLLALRERFFLQLDGKNFCAHVVVKEDVPP